MTLNSGGLVIKNGFGRMAEGKFFIKYDLKFYFKNKIIWMLKLCLVLILRRFHLIRNVSFFSYSSE